MLELLPGSGESLQFLDVGCGTGDYTRVLLERGHCVDAIDISDSAIQKAVKRVPERLRSRFRAQVGDFSLLGQQARYDGIICSEVLEHVQDDESLLRHLYASLLPRGRLILSVPADPSLWTEDDLFSGHVRRYTREGLVAKLEGAGFEIMNLWSYGFPILRIYSWLKVSLLGGKTVEVLVRREGGVGRWVVRLVATIINALVWLLDRHFLHTNRGIGFVVRCQKA
jgi:SAM-dependent methyltransferase